MHGLFSSMVYSKYILSACLQVPTNHLMHRMLLQHYGRLIQASQKCQAGVLQCPYLCHPQSAENEGNEQQGGEGWAGEHGVRACIVCWDTCVLYNTTTSQYFRMNKEKKYWACLEFLQAGHSSGHAAHPHAQCHYPQHCHHYGYYCCHC